MNVKWVVRVILLVLLASNVAACRCTGPSAPGAATDLSAERTRVQCRHPGQAIEDVAVGDHEPVATGDQINTDQNGLGILTFADFLRVEVFRKTGLQVKAAPDPNAPPIVKLYLALGATRQELQKRAGERVDVTTDTDWATIRAVATTYLISVEDDRVTWVVLFDGEAEVEAQAQMVVVRAGQATWVEPGQPPHTPIAVDLRAVEEWMEGLRRIREVGPIRPVVLPPQVEDRTEPWLEVRHSPDEPNEGQPVTVIAEAGDSESGLDRIEVQIPGQPLVTCRESSCEATGGPYSPGEYSYEAWAFDRVGNVAHRVGIVTVVSRQPVDQTEPWLEVRHSPSEPNEGQPVTVIAEAGDSESGLDRIEVQIPGQLLVACKESPCEVTGGPYLAGEYSYEVRAFDQVGNVAYREGHFAVAATHPSARFSLSIGGGPFNTGLVQKALGFSIDWAALRDGIGEVVLVDLLSGETLAGPTEPAYSPDRAKQLLAEAGYPDGFSTMLLFDQGDELAAKLAEWVTSYLGRVNTSTEFIGVAPADARAKLAAMIEAGESGLLIERR
jgi:hypothetical protein